MFCTSAYIASVRNVGRRLSAVDAPKQRLAFVLLRLQLRKLIISRRQIVRNERMIVVNSRL